MRKSLLAALLLLFGLSCNRGRPPLPQGAAPPPTFFTAQTTDTHFRGADEFLATIEMQLSGEPLALAIGRSLAGYNRYASRPDLYIDPNTQFVTLDPMGYSMAVESWEYSRQPAHNTSFESGAGLALQYGPLQNPDGVTGDAAFRLLRDRLQALAVASGTDGPEGTNWVVSPAPTDNPLNYYGWPGYWPTFAEFRSFRPEIMAAGGATHHCRFVFGYAAASANSTVGDYECGYNSLNLPDRDAQVEKVLDPAALGFGLWKQALLVTAYWQSMHDNLGGPIAHVAPADLPMVGKTGNQVVGQYPDPADPSGQHMLDGFAGVYLGDVPLEGWQGLTILDEMDNKAAFTLRTALTADGATAAGFASTREAIAYDYQSPLRWWPAAIAVTETGSPPPGGTSWKAFPKPTAFAIDTPTSRLRALAALAGGNAHFFALTDAKNPAIGGRSSCLATFDGDPMAADNQLPDGEESPHDRALANLKVAIVDMDRMHFDPAHGVLVDEVTVQNGAPQRGATVSTVDAAYAIVALRTAYRGITSTLTLYSNDGADAHGLPSALDGAPLRGAPAPLPARILQLIAAEADFISAHLVGADGAVANSFDLAAGAADASPTLLSAEAGAIRGLLEASLATGNAKYEETAFRVYSDLDRRFWMNDVRAFRTTAGTSDAMTWSPLVFGAVQGALREIWKRAVHRAGDERLAAEVLERIQRTNKLIANGWDDANGDNAIQYPTECTGAGLQMAERALTGELSHPADGPDRDHDCVVEISAAQRPAALAGEVVFKRR